MAYHAISRDEDEVDNTLPEDADDISATLLHRSAPTIEVDAVSSLWLRQRHIFVAVSFFGTTLVYFLRSNLSVAIVPMAAQYAWSKTFEGMAISAYFYGYVAAQAFGGPLALSVGGRRTVAVCATVAAFLGLLTPLAAEAGRGPLIATRAAMGLAEGAIFPSIHMLIAQWAPRDERSMFAATIYSGNSLGTALALGLTGAQLASADDAGWAWARIGGGTSAWPAVFYVHSTVALAWVILWWICVYDTPELHPRISKAEVVEIRGMAGNAATESTPQPPSLAALRAVPWRRLFTCVPFWAIVANHFTTNFTTYVLSSWIPTFIKEQLGQPIDAAGALAVLPYVACALVAVLGGLAADRVIASRMLGTTAVRKLWQCSSQVITAAVLLGVAQVASPAAAIAMLVVVVGASGLTEAGYHCNHIDIAPAYAGVAFALTNLVGNCGGIVGPQLVGAMLDPGPGAPAGAVPTTAMWRSVFGLTAGVNMVGCIVWAAFASGNVQVR